VRKIRISAGAGYGGDRFEPAIELIEKGNINYLVYECLAERTIALYQLAKTKNPELGYNPQLEKRLRPVLEPCFRKGIRIITNMGAANPIAAGEKVAQMARDLGLHGLKIAIVLGDDVIDIIKNYSGKVLETGEDLEVYSAKMVSANAYLGCQAITEALLTGAGVVITGRVADPSLFLAPMVYEFGWRLNDYSVLGQGTVIGHLLECAGQVTGGYFADPGYKDVPRLWELGFPIAEVQENGEAIITKPEGSGGLVSEDTCKEQLLYEIHDPAAYVTPDCIADFTGVCLKQIGSDQVKVTGGNGRERPEQLKVSIGYFDSYIGEGEMSYGGAGAVERAQLAAGIVRRRLELRGSKPLEIRYDLIGIDSLHGTWISQGKGQPYEVRLRVAGRFCTKEEAEIIGDEVETLYTNGPAAGGGAKKSVREVLAVISTLVPRSKVQTKVLLKEA